MKILGLSKENYIFKITLTLLIGFLVSTTLTNCASSSKKRAPITANQNDILAYKQAKSFLERGQAKKGLIILQRLSTKQPINDVTDDAYFLMANYYFSKKNYVSAYRNYLPIIKSEFYSPKESKAYLQSAYCLKYNGQPDEALSLINTGLSRAEMDMPTKIKSYEFKAQLEEKNGDHFSSAKSLAFLAQNHPNQNIKAQSLTKAKAKIETKIPGQNLKSLAEDRSLPSEIIAVSNYKYGEHLYNSGDKDGAFKYFNNVVTSAPTSDYATKAKTLFSNLKASTVTDPYSIGVILPLTGRHRHIGQKTLKGIQLALGVFGDTPSNFKLSVFDSQSDPDVASQGVEKLVKEDHVIAIIGGLLSRTSQVIANLSNQYQVPNISLSQKSKLTDIGDFIFRNAITGELQIRTLVKTAMEKKGIKTFAILYPNDNYGTEYANIFWSEVRARGGQVTSAQSYKPKETDFKSHIKKLVGTYYLEDRQSEYRHHLNKWYSKNKGRRKSPPDDLLPPIVDFQALFIPDSPKALGQIAPMLNYYNVEGVTLLGTNIWNQPSLIKRGQKYVEGALFVEDLSVFNSAYKNTKFYEQFKKTFEEEPNTFSAQAFDTAKLLTTIIENGERSRIDVRRRLAGLRSFTGAKGKILINNRREMVSPLIGLTVKDREIISIE